MVYTLRLSRTLQGDRTPCRRIAWPLTVLFCLSTVLAGCSSLERRARPVPELLELRQTTNARLMEDSHRVIGRMVTRVKAQYDAYQAGRLATPPVIDILVVSGGGDWGAFGAGFLKGWGRVPPGPMARPQFDIVTGVSTGALIAPFAFLGTDDAIERIVQLYRHPKPDWVKHRGIPVLPAEQHLVRRSAGARARNARADRRPDDHTAGRGRGRMGACSW